MAHAIPPPTARLFTREEYHRMGEAGVFLQEGERVELLDREVVVMSPQSSLHAGSVHRIQRALQQAFGSTALVRAQLPTVLDDRSEPEPDVAVCRPRTDDYTRSHPAPEDIFLLVEVADSSLAYDRARKARAYARAGIPTYP